VRKREEIWGDDRSERDADATIAELNDAEVSAGQRGWHKRWVLFPLKVVGHFIGRNAKRVGITIAGFALILAGIAMLVLPGPGWAAIFLGLAVLATEYVWAQRTLNFAKRKATEAKNKVLRKKEAKARERETSAAPVEGPDAPV
jgi:uncharacterized protein (TIGR02611 family)